MSLHHSLRIAWHVVDREVAIIQYILGYVSALAARVREVARWRVAFSKVVGAGKPANSPGVPQRCGQIHDVHAM